MSKKQNKPNDREKSSHINRKQANQPSNKTLDDIPINSRPLNYLPFIGYRKRFETKEEEENREKRRSCLLTCQAGRHSGSPTYLYIPTTPFQVSQSTDQFLISILPIITITTTTTSKQTSQQTIRDNTRSQNSVEYGMQQPDAPFNVSSYLRTETEAAATAAATSVREV